jgi:hypothetical protein
MLERLETHQRGFIIDPFLTITVEEWRQSSRNVLDTIQQGKLGATIIIRNAVITEDIDPNVPRGFSH